MYISNDSQQLNNYVWTAENIYRRLKALVVRKAILALCMTIRRIVLRNLMRFRIVYRLTRRRGNKCHLTNRTRHREARRRLILMYQRVQAVPLRKAMAAKVLPTLTLPRESSKVRTLLAVRDYRRDLGLTARRKIYSNRQVQCWAKRRCSRPKVQTRKQRILLRWHSPREWRSSSGIRVKHL